MNIDEKWIEYEKEKSIKAVRMYVYTFIVMAIFWAVMAFNCANAHSLEVDMDIIKMIESSGNVEAFNRKTQARGLYQITPICLKDYNNYHKDKISVSNLFLETENEKVATWYMSIRIPQMLRFYGQPQTKENILIAYNCGINCVIKGRLPKETRDYIKKYKNLEKMKLGD